MKLFDLINPKRIAEYFTFYGGGGNSGGGSSNPDTRYANLDQLYGVQTQASKFMLDNAMPNVPVVTENSSKMVSDAMDGTLATQLRDRAGADSAATMGAALDANQRNMQRFGMGFNANRLLSENNKNAIMGAAQKTAAMNKADQFAEDQKWNRNAGFFGQVTGMNSGAMQGLSSAGNGMGNVAYQQSLSDQKNAAGYGQAGSQFASSLFKADGGYIEKPAKLASGGDAWAAYKAANPVVTSPSSGGRSKKSQSGFSQMVGGAMPSLLGSGLKDVLNLDGKGGKLVKAGKDMYGKGEAWFRTAQAQQEAAQKAQEVQATESSIDSGGIGAGYDPTYTGGGEYGTDAWNPGSDGVVEMDVGTSDAANAVSADAATAGTSVGAAPDVAAGADYMGETTSSFSDASSLWAADGGYIKKNRFAMGGLTGSSVASSNKVDGTSAVANMDASSNMIVAKMDDVEPTKKPTLAVPVGGKPAYDGDTEGMGETSTGDKDGFGSKSADNRHMAGTTAIKTVGNRIFPFLGTVLGDTVADAIHPIMEPVTRNGIMIGDTIGRAVTGNSEAGGAVGAFLTDPIGAAFSGKYFADGGETNVEREDFTPGGEVAGPGTETSDDIPAWLSDGEIVHNADAVDLAGKDALLAINEEGLKARRGEKDPEQAKQDIGKVMIERGKELVSGNRIAARGLIKHGVKLAGGGFLGGNMGIAMGAGVDQYNKQQMIDQHQQALDLQKQASARQDLEENRRAEEFKWKQAEVGDANALKGEIKDISNKYNTVGNVEDYIKANDESAKAAAKEAGVEPALLGDAQKEVLRNSVKAGQNTEFSNAFNKFAQIDKAESMKNIARHENTIADLQRNKDASIDDRLKILAQEDPKQALALEVQAQSRRDAIAAQAQARIDALNERKAQHLRDEQYRRDLMNLKYPNGASGKSGAAGGNEWDIKDINTEVNQVTGEDPGLTKIVDGKPVPISKADMVIATREALNTLNGAGMPLQNATPIAYQMARRRLTGEGGDDFAPKPMFDPSTGKTVFTMQDSTGKSYSWGGNRQISDAELLKHQNGDKVVQARDKFKAESTMMAFDAADKDQARKSDLMSRLGLKSEDDYQMARAKVIADWQKFDPVASKIESDVANAQARSAAGSANRQSNRQEDNPMELANAIKRVKANTRPGDVPGMVDYLKEWFVPTIGVKK